MKRARAWFKSDIYELEKEFLLKSNLTPYLLAYTLYAPILWTMSTIDTAPGPSKGVRSKSPLRQVDVNAPVNSDEVEVIEISSDTEEEDEVERQPRVRKKVRRRRGKSGECYGDLVRDDIASDAEEEGGSALSLQLEVKEVSF